MAPGAGVMEGLPDQPGLATLAKLKGNRGVKDMSRLARAFTGPGHPEHVAAGWACVLRKQHLEVEIPYPFFIGIDVFDNTVDLTDQWIAHRRPGKRRNIR